MSKFVANIDAENLVYFRKIADGLGVEYQVGEAMPLVSDKVVIQTFHPILMGDRETARTAIAEYITRSVKSGRQEMLRWDSLPPFFVDENFRTEFV